LAKIKDAAHDFGKESASSIGRVFDLRTSALNGGGFPPTHSAHLSQRGFSD
jgi:hypothetical protein